MNDVQFEPAMAKNEISLLDSLLASSRIYGEFGCGGSTVHACSMVTDRVISVDSSQEWLDQVAARCSTDKLRLFHVDIGPVKEWGWPVSTDKRDFWPAYHSSVWDLSPDAVEADTFLVDGRFRVACFLQILKHCGQRPLIAIHDFQRIEYKVVENFASLVASAGQLSVFRGSNSLDAECLISALNSYKYSPS